MREKDIVETIKFTSAVVYYPGNIRRALEINDPNFKDWLCDCGVVKMDGEVLVVEIRRPFRVEAGGLGGRAILTPNGLHLFEVNDGIVTIDHNNVVLWRT